MRSVTWRFFRMMLSDHPTHRLQTVPSIAGARLSQMQGIPFSVMVGWAHNTKIEGPADMIKIFWKRPLLIHARVIKNCNFDKF